jgi:abhydrolase domain-containing protein 17
MFSNDFMSALLSVHLYACKMGNTSVGFDSIASVDGAIQQVLFQPPVRGPDEIQKALAEHKSTEQIFCRSKSGIDVSVVCVRPKSGQKCRKYAVLSHGNGCDNLSVHPFLQKLSNDYDVCAVSYDYPYYGLTTSKADIKPTEESCVECLTSVIDHLTRVRKVDPSQLVLLAQSLGTGVTMSFAAANDWRGDIGLISPYKSIPRVVSDSSLATKLVTQYRFDSFSHVKNVRCRVKIFHGKRDAVIPWRHGQELYEQLPNKALAPVWIDDAGHNDILSKIGREHLAPLLAG